MDEDWWAEYWDLSEVRRFIEGNVLGMYVNENDPEVEAWYEELGLAMGGKEVKSKIAWPVVFLLPSKSPSRNVWQPSSVLIGPNGSGFYYRQT